MEIIELINKVSKIEFSHVKRRYLVLFESFYYNSIYYVVVCAVKIVPIL